MQPSRAHALALGLAVALAGCGVADGQPAPAATTGGPIVLELFTSQGCSSCPAAERLLGELARAGSFDGRPIAPLAFHVDYWDDLGWADPYASPAWTERQRRYAQALGDTRVYTPELVVGGAAGMVGSNPVAVSGAITRATRPAALPVTAQWSATELALTATAPADADVVVAVWEDAPRTAVPRGENAGTSLVGDRVVRRLEKVATRGTRGTVRIPLDPSWKQVGAVAFAQRTDQRITASALLPR